VAENRGRNAESGTSAGDQGDDAAALRDRIATLEAELEKMRSETARSGREARRELRQQARDEGRDRVESVKEIVERVDNEGRRLFRAVVLSQMEQLRLTADLIGSFAERIERQNPPDDPDVERDLPRDLLDGWLESVDRSLDIPEKAIETFDDTYKRARHPRRAGETRSETSEARSEVGSA
jgi:hypothetical protein